MSFLDTLRQWDKAVTFVDRQDLPEALSIFLSIQEPNSKIYFDIGCLHLLNQDLDAAEKVWPLMVRGRLKHCTQTSLCDSTRQKVKSCLDVADK